MPNNSSDAIIVGGLNPVEGKVVSVPTHAAINEAIEKKDEAGDTIVEASPLEDGDEYEKDNNSDDVIIVTGTDAANHLLSLRDDGQSALTFRSIFLASGLSAFQAVMSQIYSVSDTWASLLMVFMPNMDRLTFCLV
jgi:hypothetical protein